jgi:hypothetical protein
MHRRTFAQSLVAATLLPQAATAREPSRFTRLVWGHPWGDPETSVPSPIANGMLLVAWGDETNSILAALGPSNVEKFGENYTERRSRYPHEMVQGALPSFPEPVFVMASCEPRPYIAALCDIPRHGQFPIISGWLKETDTLLIDHHPEGYHAQLLRDRGLPCVAMIEENHKRTDVALLIVGDIDLNGWVEV